MFSWVLYLVCIFCVYVCAYLKQSSYSMLFVKQIPLDHVCFSQMCFSPLRRSLHKPAHQIALLDETLKICYERIFKHILWIDPSWHSWYLSLRAAKHCCLTHGCIIPSIDETLSGNIIAQFCWSLSMFY